MHERNRGVAPRNMDDTALVRTESPPGAAHLPALAAVLLSVFIGGVAAGLSAQAAPPVAVPAQAGLTQSELTAYVKEARSLAGSYASRLQGELSAALQAGGPEGAVPICRVVAPGAANELTEQHGWSVARTALRVRNPRNAPTLEERAVLVDFQQRALAGEPISAMEHVAVVDDGPVTYLHYMWAIPTGGVCLACHGPDVSDETLSVIRSIYPADAATGFELGELRGAFTFVRPLRPRSSEEEEQPSTSR